MKAIFLHSIFLITGVFALVQMSAEPAYKPLDISKQVFLTKSLHVPETLMNSLITDKFICYTSGEMSWDWVIITSENSNFKFFSGNTNGSDRPKAAFDTTRLIKDNESLLTWAIDSMPHESLVMKRIQSDHYISTNWNLWIFTPEYEGVMDLNNLKTYVGPGSEEFYKKVMDLQFLCMWLAHPELRRFRAYMSE
jgi:hypothetical protein